MGEDIGQIFSLCACSTGLRSAGGFATSACAIYKVHFTYNACPQAEWASLTEDDALWRRAALAAFRRQTGVCGTLQINYALPYTQTPQTPQRTLWIPTTRSLSGLRQLKRFRNHDCPTCLLHPDPHQDHLPGSADRELQQRTLWSEYGHFQRGFQRVCWRNPFYPKEYVTIARRFKTNRQIIKAEEEEL